MELKNIENISDIITYQSTIRPDNIAVKFLDKNITYLELEKLVASVSSFLYEKDVREKDVVAIETENEFFILVLMFSIAKLGATILNIPNSTPKTLRSEIIEKVNVKHFYSEKNIDIDKIKEDYKTIDNSIFCKSPNSPFILLIGSGSTGKKKVIPLNHSEEISRVSNSYQWLTASSEDNVATCVHLNFLISKDIYLATFFVGGTVVLFDKNRLNLQEIYEKYNISILHATVFHIGKLILFLPKNDSYKLPLLKKLYVGGSTVSDFMRNEILKKITSNLTVRYGINEVGTIASIDYTKSSSSATVGKCLQSIQVEIVDPNDTNLPVNKVGEIRIKSKGLIRGYLNDEESTSNAFKNGWFYPKDLGKFTEDGELIHMGRADEMMIMNGINIYPIEIEQTMIKHEAIEDVSVLAIKSRIHQDIPVCAVVLKKSSSLSVNQLMKYSFDKLGSSAPRKIVILDSIPKNEQGKIKRVELKNKIDKKLLLISEKKNKSNPKERLIEVAKTMNIPVLPYIENTNLWQFGWGVNSKVFDVSSPLEDSYHGVKISMDKVQSKKLLKNIGMPISNHRVIQSKSELESASKIIGFPCVVKPIRGAGGVGITSNIQNYDDLQVSYENAKDSSFGKNSIMIEGFIEGDDYRLIVSNGEFLAAIRRSPTHIIGDGKSTVKELILEINEKRNEKKTFLQEIKFDQKLISHLKRFDLLLDTVLEKNRDVSLSSTANILSGGEGEDVSSIIHPQLKQMAENISKVTGICVLGIDYITTDITKPYSETDGKITEFNHYISLTSADFFSDTKYFFERLLGSGPFRIPIVFIIVKEENLETISNYLKINLKKKILAGHQKEIFAGELKLKEDNSLSSNIRILLRQKTLKIAIIVFSEDDMKRRTLYIDKVDVIYNCDVDLSLKIKNDIKLATKNYKKINSIEDLLSLDIQEIMNPPLNNTDDNERIESLISNKKTFNLKLEKKNMPSNIELIDKWFDEVLSIDIDKSFKSKVVVNQVVHRALKLATVLFQAINIPIFDIGKINKSFYDHKSREYAIDIDLNIIDYISNNIFQIVLEQSSNIVTLYLNKSITSKSKQELFRYMNNYILYPYRRVSGSGKSTIPILREAYNLNIPFMHLGSGVYQLGWGRNSRRIDRSTTQFDSAIGAKMAQSKMLTSNLVRDAGLPAPENELVNTKRDASKAASKLGFPVVVKPSDQDRGEGITIGIKNEEDLFIAFDIAKKSSRAKKVIIEKEVLGTCHRLFIANGKLLYAVKRLPKSVLGDGINTVKELIAIANKKERNAPPWLKSEAFPMDKLAVIIMKKAGFDLEDIPNEKEVIPLREIESTKWGGRDEDVTNTISQENIDIAITSANLFGLYVSGIDIISPDITKPWHENGAIINEVNFSPLFGGGDISRKTIPKFLEEFMTDHGRIPITFLDEKISYESARIIQKEKQLKGINCFLITYNQCLENRMKPILLNLTADEIIIIKNNK